MIEAHEYGGRWWPAGQSKKQRFGTLYYSVAEGLRLEIDGAFVDPWMLFAGASTDANTESWIVGKTSLGKPIALQNCMFRSIQAGKTIYQADFGLIGYAHRWNSTFRIREAQITYHNLLEWTRTSWADEYLFASDLSTVEFRFSRREPIVLGETDECKISVLFGENIKLMAPESTYHPTASVQMQFLKPQSLDGLMGYVRRFQEFLTLVTGEPSFPTSIDAFTEIRRTPETRSRNPIFILYEPILPPNRKPMHSGNVRLSLKRLNDLSVAAVKNWFDKSSVLRPTFDLYFSNLYAPFAYLEHRFLNLTTALETYHRLRYGGKYQEDEHFRNHLYEQLVAAIPLDIGKDFRNSLVNGKLKYANEYSLRTRIKELLATVGPCLPDRFLES